MSCGDVASAEEKSPEQLHDMDAMKSAMESSASDFHGFSSDYELFDQSTNNDYSWSALSEAPSQDDWFE